jgi:hypothetical protein
MIGLTIGFPFGTARGALGGTARSVRVVVNDGINVSRLVCAALRDTTGTRHGRDGRSEPAAMRRDMATRDVP